MATGIRGVEGRGETSLSPEYAIGDVRVAEALITLMQTTDIALHQDTLNRLLAAPRQADEFNKVCSYLPYECADAELREVENLLARHLLVTIALSNASRYSTRDNWGGVIDEVNEMKTKLRPVLRGITPAQVVQAVFDDRLHLVSKQNDTISEA